MNAEQLAYRIEEMIRTVKHRIMNVGVAEYDEGEVQKIEQKSTPNLIRETIEEVDDAIVYLAFLRTKLSESQSEWLQSMGKTYVFDLDEDSVPLPGQIMVTTFGDDVSRIAWRSDKFDRWGPPIEGKNG